MLFATEAQTISLMQLLSAHSFLYNVIKYLVDSIWNVMAHGDAREGTWRGNWRIQWVASTLHTTSEYDVSSITTADAHTLAASSRLNWSPRWFKWTRPFRRKTKYGFCACDITFQLASSNFALNIYIQQVMFMTFTNPYQKILLSNVCVLHVSA